MNLLGLVLQGAEMVFQQQEVTEGIFALIMGMLAVFVLIAIGLYVYTSLAFMKIAKKTNTPSPGLAWIPYVGPAIIANRISKMHWWPLLLLIGMFIPFINFIAGIAFIVFFVIWNWKMFEALNRPGWWAIFIVIPIVQIVYLVFLGIAAWGGQQSVANQAKGKR